MTPKEISEQLKSSNFLEKFLEGYIGQGFGQMPARQTQLLLLQLLTENVKGWKNDPPMWELSRTLKISPRRLRGLLDDLAYMDAEKTDEWCRNELKKLFTESHEIVKSGEAIRVQIDDGLVRDFAITRIRQRYGVVEFGMNSAIVELSGTQFSILAMSLLDEKDAERVIAAIPNKARIAQQNAQKSKSVLRMFIDAFAESAGKQAGKKSVDLGFAILTGGASEAIDLVKSLVSSD